MCEFTCPVEPPPPPPPGLGCLDTWTHIQYRKKFAPSGSPAPHSKPRQWEGGREGGRIGSIWICPWVRDGAYVSQIQYSNAMFIPLGWGGGEEGAGVERFVM